MHALVLVNINLPSFTYFKDMIGPRNLEWVALPRPRAFQG